MHAFSPSTQEAEVGGSLSVRGQPWSTRASSRTVSKATEKPCLEKQKQTTKIKYTVFSEINTYLTIGRGLKKDGMQKLCPVIQFLFICLVCVSP